MKARVIGRVTSVVVVAALGGCHSFEEGPPLRVDVDPGFTAQPTAGRSDLCCCEVIGTAHNLSSVTVHATIRFSANPVNPAVDSEGTAIDFMPDLLPDEVRPIKAAGLLLPCDHFNRFDLVDVDIRGIAFPP